MAVQHKPDSFQQEAIECTARSIRIVAPAGSGKTETIARRVAHRIEQGVDPRRILVLTFDNAAQKSLKSFLAEALDRRRLPDVRSLNSHGLKILKTWFPDEEAETYLTDRCPERRQLAAQFDPHHASLSVLTWDGVPRTLVDGVFTALKEQGWRPSVAGDADKAIKWMRRDYFRLPEVGESTGLDDLWGLPDASVATDAYSPQLGEIWKLFVEYDQACRDLDVMEFTDQKARAFSALWSKNRPRTELQGLFDEVIVDEAQDLNRLDALLILVTVHPDATLVLAGDDDQTLYEFRNAHSIYLREPERFYSGRDFTTITLDINYRSPEAILDPAMRLVAHNVERIEKATKSGVADPGQLTVLAAEDRAGQAKQLADLLRAELDAGRKPEEIGVLCQQDSHKWIERVFKDAGIPMHRERNNRVEQPGVEVVTYFKAKGRQWPVVILADTDDAHFPDDDSIRKGEVESIRRRFYVAMTRASEHLVLTYLRDGDEDRVERTADGEIVGTNGASRFLFEAGIVRDVTPADVEEVAPQPEVVAQDAQAADVQSPALTEKANTPASAPQPVVPVETEKQPDPAPAKVAPVQQPDPTPVVTTPVPQPAAASAWVADVPKKKAKLQPWDLRQAEIKRLADARRYWDMPDYEYGFTCAWKAVEAVVVRLFGKTVSGQPRTVFEAFRYAEDTVGIRSDWSDKFHDWRQLRNVIAHSAHDAFGNSDANRIVGYELVDQAPDFLEYLTGLVAPKQTSIVTHDAFITRMSNLVDIVRQGKPHPKTKRPLKAIRFNPEREARDILVMQLAMMLRDGRFYIPEEFRWTSSPLMSKFAVDVLGWVPSSVRPSSKNRAAGGTPAEQEQTIARMKAMLNLCAGDNDPAQFLNDRLRDAAALQNGDFHAGLKFDPKYT